MFKRVSDRFSDPFSRFSNRFSYRFKSFSGAVSFCRHAALISCFFCLFRFPLLFCASLPSSLRKEKNPCFGNVFPLFPRKEGLEGQVLETVLDPFWTPALSQFRAQRTRETPMRGGWVCNLSVTKLRRTNVQQLTCKMVWSFSFYSLLFSFILFELKQQ